MKFAEDYYPKEFMMTIQVLKMRNNIRFSGGNEPL